MNGSDPPLTDTMESLRRERDEARKESIDRLIEKGRLLDEIERLKSSPTIDETDALIARLRLGVTKGHEPSDEDAIEAAEALHRLSRNQITASSVTLAQAGAMQAQRADALERKCAQFTDALMRAMSLIDELVRENGRLCAASDEPPSVKLFAAKRSFDTAMHKLLGDEPSAP